CIGLSRFEIEEQPHSSSASLDSDGDQIQGEDGVPTEQDYEEALRDQWIPMGE
ncbi:hypothetical protein BGZ92_006867, partial [Podila epicladia]